MLILHTLVFKLISSWQLQEHAEKILTTHHVYAWSTQANSIQRESSDLHNRAGKMKLSFIFVSILTGEFR